MNKITLNSCHAQLAANGNLYVSWYDCGGVLRNEKVSLDRAAALVEEKRQGWGNRWVVAGPFNGAMVAAGH